MEGCSRGERWRLYIYLSDLLCITSQNLSCSSPNKMVDVNSFDSKLSLKVSCNERI